MDSGSRDQPESEAEYAAFDQLEEEFGDLVRRGIVVERRMSDAGIGRAVDDGPDRPTAPDELVVSLARVRERERKLLQDVADWCEAHARQEYELRGNYQRAIGYRKAGAHCLELIKRRRAQEST